jgi:hypothetical protein
MILVIASRADLVGPLLAEVLIKKWPCRLVIAEDIGHHVFFDTEGLIAFGDKFVYGDIKIIFNRILNIPFTQLGACRNWQNLMSLLETGLPIVVNRPEVVMGNFFKPCQMRILAKFFHVPKTFLASYVPLNVKKMVVKSISSVRSVVGHAEDLGVTYAVEPVLVQRFYAGFHVRLHVIGEFYTAVCIYAKGVDYRYCQNAQFDFFNCPLAVVNKAKAFMKMVGAVFCGFDFIVHHRRWICLEANMAPGFVYFDQQSKKPLVMQEVVNWVQTFF